MRTTITAAGSRGDVQPYVVLGLEETGHEAPLAAPAIFEELVCGHGLGFCPISLVPLEGVRRQLERGEANLFEFAWRSKSILGGAGTMAASWRAGTPTVVPFFADQSFWGARVVPRRRAAPHTAGQVLGRAACQG